MGQSANRGRLFLHEVVLSLHQLGAEGLSCDLGKNGAERQPGDVLGAGEIRCKNAHVKNRFESGAAKNKHGCGTWRRFRALRLFARDCAGLCVFLDASGDRGMTGSRALTERKEKELTQRPRRSQRTQGRVTLE